jgi:hypothetical protein
VLFTIIFLATVANLIHAFHHRVQKRVSIFSHIVVDRKKRIERKKIKITIEIRTQKSQIILKMN